ncbi:DUF1207 domain-containing protein [Fimbriiglobus ruber]|uniref:DUF1207 domain-containing protein n=1 Tax=Fimbriiglobus ruber TaxID=1908690 RepID=A0A225DHJ7_9BACT|nr:DUF1207 domain-containing protein [Fimbriiglobus ruber]OWK38038.1 hypothetical protein FRUB_07158 [Fimbriiglobus ruber]
MPGLVGHRWALFAVAAGVILSAAGPGQAQRILTDPSQWSVAVSPVLIKVPAGPGTAGWPVPLGQQPPAVLPAQPVYPLPAQSPPPGVPGQSFPLPTPAPLPGQPSATTVLGAPPSVIVGSPLLDGPPVGTRPVDLQPLPGSLMDTFGQEYEARKQLRTTTWKGTTITAFPNSLLWTPPLAGPREPRMQVIGGSSSLSGSDSSTTVDTEIGGTLGIARFQPVGEDLSFQLDFFAMVNSRFVSSDLLVADYRFGIPISFQWGEWHGKLAYEYTSSHLGDSYIRDSTPAQIPVYTKDEVVLGIDRYLFRDLRVYGIAAYAFQQTLPPYAPGQQNAERSKGRFSGGFEWAPRLPTNWSGGPFVAANVDADGTVGYNASLTAQVGWLWRNPLQRLASLRVFAEYYDGHSPYGQLYMQREKFYAVGMAADY